jgi:hypothetical protein
MTEKEMLDHFDYIDGIQKAQMLVVRLLVKQNPKIAEQLGDYLLNADANGWHDDLSKIQREAMENYISNLI